MLVLGVTIPPEFLKTYFIGVGLEQDRKALAELLVISALGGDTSEIFNIGNANIEEVFNRIQVDLGVLAQH